ncbi:MAG: family 16 glycosylhydrolase [Clostridia bacterium]|nr:family 16 glycosylhydrolase [Clostridia bacterium]
MKKVISFMSIALSIAMLFTFINVTTTPIAAEAEVTVIESFSGSTVPSDITSLYNPKLQIVSSPSASGNAIAMTIGQRYSSLVVKDFTLPEDATQLKFWAKGNTKDYAMTVKLRSQANGSGDTYKNVALTILKNGGYFTIDLTTLTVAQIKSIKSIVLTAQNDLSGTIYFDEFSYVAPSHKSPTLIEDFKTATSVPANVAAYSGSTLQIVSSPSFADNAVCMNITRLYSSLIIKDIKVPANATGIKFWAKGDSRYYNLSVKYRPNADGTGSNIKFINKGVSASGSEIILDFNGLSAAQIANIKSIMITAQNDSSGKVYFDEFHWILSGDTTTETKPVVIDKLAKDVKNVGSTMVSPITNSTYKLNFIDDFGGTSLNTSNWTVFTRNYNSSEQSVNCAKNIVVENNMLNILGLKETTQYTGSAESWETPKTSYFTGGAINSNGKKTFKYGRMEIYCKIPYSYGMWPAFWTQGVNRGWPWCGEIDIMEFVGGTDQWGNYRDDEYNSGLHWCDPTLGSDKAWSTNLTVTSSSSNDLWNSTTSKLSTGGGKFEIPNGPSKGAKLNDAWRVCGIEWTPEKMYFYCDNTVYFTVDITKTSMREAFHQNHYIILNLVMGGSWAGTPDVAKGTVFPQKFMIDWVKVWQK